MQPPGVEKGLRVFPFPPLYFMPWLSSVATSRWFNGGAGVRGVRAKSGRMLLTGFCSFHIFDDILAGTASACHLVVHIGSKKEL